MLKRYVMMEVIGGDDNLDEVMRVVITHTIGEVER